MNTSTLIPSWAVLTVCALFLLRRLFPRLSQVMSIALSIVIGGLLAGAPVIYFVLFTHLKG